MYYMAIDSKTILTPQYLQENIAMFAKKMSFIFLKRNSLSLMFYSRRKSYASPKAAHTAETLTSNDDEGANSIKQR